MGLLTQVIKKGAKVVDGLLDDAADYAGPFLTDNVTDMSAEQIDFALKNARNLDLPAWRVEDLERQLPQSREVEKFRVIRESADSQLDQISINERGGANPVIPDIPRRETKPLVDWPEKDIFSSPTRELAVPSKAASRSTADSRQRAMRNANWADPEAIDKIYKDAKRLSRATGVPHEVDHVIPLRGDYVSGLHHQDNLLIMPKFAHKGKSNSFEVGPDPMRFNDTAKRNIERTNEAFLQSGDDLIDRRTRNKKAKSEIVSAELDMELESRLGHIGKLARALRNGRHHGQGE